MAIKQISLSELGAKLPIGMQSGDAVFRDFTVKPWRMLEEKALAKAKKDTPGMNMGTYVSTIVSYMCPQLGSHTHAPKDASLKELAERRIHISNMHMADIWYVYVYIRREALGDELILKLKCPRCKEPFDWTGSLGSINVKVPEALEDAMFPYVLKRPVQIRGKNVESFVCGPSSWDVIEQVSMNPDEGVAKETTIRASVYRLNDETERTYLSIGDLDQLTKRDVEGLADAINTKHVGPSMAIDLDGDYPCPKCSYAEKRPVPINWNYDDFFGVSSS